MLRKYLSDEWMIGSVEESQILKAVREVFPEEKVLELGHEDE